MKLLVITALVSSLITGISAALLTHNYTSASYKTQIEKIKKTHAEDKATALGKMLSEQIRITQEWVEKEKVLYDEKAKSEREQDDLRKRIRDGDQRLSVVLKTRAGNCTLPETAGTGNVDNGTERAELDGAFAERIVTIANDGDAAIRQLSACQAYIKTRLN